MSHYETLFNNYVDKVRGRRGSKNLCLFFKIGNILSMKFLNAPFCSKTVWCANTAHNEQSHKTPFVFIKGCFAGGIYLALWFTILQQPDKTKPEDQVLAVLAVFPIVSRLTSVTQKIVPSALVIYYCAWYVFLHNRR